MNPCNLASGSLFLSAAPPPPAAAAASPHSGLEREVERLKSALHLSIATVQQHIASADPYSPAALLVDPASTLSAAAAQSSLSSARDSSSSRGSGDGGDGSGGDGTLGRLSGNEGEADGTAADKATVGPAGGAGRTVSNVEAV